jgi:glycosyltransferase involved in cell wall biosynthesis
VLKDAATTELGSVAVELTHVIAGYRAFEAWGADLVHDHTLSGPVYARCITGLNVVTTNHGPFDERLTPVYEAICEHVPIIAISHHQARSAPGVRIARVIHHGLDVETVPIGMGLGDERGPYLLNLSRMNSDKGVREAVEVARRSGWRLLIASKMREPAEREYFHDQIEPLLDGDVEFLGEVSGAERDRLLGGATALLNPIQWPEPFGLVMIEALAAGTPIVSSDRGSAPELIEHGVTGFVCRDLDEMVALVPCAARLDRSACRRDAETRFSTQRMVNEHLDLFAEVVGERSVA